MKQQIYNTALYLRLSRDDELQGESSSITMLITKLIANTVFKLNCTHN